jgi:hypothetical protein
LSLLAYVITVISRRSSLRGRRVRRLRSLQVRLRLQSASYSSITDQNSKTQKVPFFIVLYVFNSLPSIPSLTKCNAKHVLDNSADGRRAKTTIAAIFKSSRYNSSSNNTIYANQKTTKHLFTVSYYQKIVQYRTASHSVLF